MSDVFFPLAAAFVILAWVGAAHIIRHWGVGVGNRSVRCPHENRRATISTFSCMRDGWGSVVERDILQCSLLGSRPVTCDKSCLTQLQ